MNDQDKSMQLHLDQVLPLIEDVDITCSFCT